LKERVMNKGLIFDIQRFSTNDGPGIRTTVFFKGCGLRCQWCHNPESIASYPQLSYDPLKCDACGKCVDFVHQHGIKLVDKKAEVDFSIHDRNLELIAVCPKKAFSVLGREIDSNTLISEVMKDCDYYETSGGGVSFSGGEALNQWPFIEECAQVLKQKGIHLTLDISGNDPAHLLSSTMKLIDLYLVDFKLSSDNLYEKYLGKRFNPYECLEILRDGHKDVILRCVLIPNVNEESTHFDEIKQLKLSFPNIMRVDLLPYHAMKKRQQFKLVNERVFFEVPSKATLEHWKSEIIRCGIRDVFLENQEIIIK